MPQIRYAEHSPTPWANGGGTTVELVSLAASQALTPGLPQWRLSIACLHRPAPFSPLPGMQRQFLPVGGSVVLTIDGERVPVAEGTVCAFDGAAAVELVELTGACHAINLMAAGTDHDMAALTLTRIATGQSAPDHTMFAIPLTQTTGANQFDLIRPSETAAYSAACTGPWAAIAKSGCHSAPSPRTAS